MKTIKLNFMNLSDIKTIIKKLTIKIKFSFPKFQLQVINLAQYFKLIRICKQI